MRSIDEENLQMFRHQNQAMANYIKELRKIIREAIDHINDDSICKVLLQHAPYEFPSPHMKNITIPEDEYRKYKKVMDLFNELSEQIKRVI